MKIRAVLDTNVLISGVIWRGTPFRLLKWAEEDVLAIYTSLGILEEVYRVLHYTKIQQYIDINEASPVELFTKIESLCTIVQVEQNVNVVSSDPDDDKFISCALASNVSALVTGDKHLLDLKEYASVRIMTAQEFYQENVKKIRPHE